MILGMSGGVFQAEYSEKYNKKCGKISSLGLSAAYGTVLRDILAVVGCWKAARGGRGRVKALGGAVRV